MPAWMVPLADPVAPLIGRAIGRVVWRKGRLARAPEARAEVLAQLEPLDIVLVSNRGRLSNNTLPGYFSHAAIYAGTAAQLRRAGVWDDPHVRPYREKVEGGHWFIEADQRGVHVSTLEDVLNVDRLVVLRPHLANAARRRKALSDYFAALGGRFDFHFDLATPDCVFCTELIFRTVPELDLEVRRAYDRDIILPDDLAKAAALGHPRLSAVLYIRADEAGWARLPRKALVRDLAAYWDR